MIGANWDSDINPLPCDRYNNAELLITLRVFLAQANPAGGAAEGTAQEWGTDASGTGSGHGTHRKIIRWSPATWDTWCKRYQREVQAFWDGRFWLVARHSFADLDFTDRSITYRPNIWCRFRLEFPTAAAGAHVSISVVRLHASESSFRSDAGHYDNRDLDTTARTQAGVTYNQRAHVHEVGHLLGLPHASESDAACVAAGNVGAEACYCATPDDCKTIMGYGEGRRASFAEPWQKAMERHGGGTTSDWEVVMRRHYPRTLADVAAGTQIIIKPSRG
jgi:hypothetical protein